MKGKKAGSDETYTKDPVLSEIIRRLVKAYDPKRIYLFGSTARGDETPDSDYDIMVIVPDNAVSERKRSRLAYEKLWGTGRGADVLVWTESQFDDRLCLKSSLPSTIRREGSLLYGS